VSETHACFTCRASHVGVWRCVSETEKRRASTTDAADVETTTTLTASTATVTVKAAAAAAAASPGERGWSADESRHGSVSLRTYTAYVTAAGGALAVVAVLVASLVAEGARAFSFWWLAYWLEQGSGTANVRSLYVKHKTFVSTCRPVISDCHKLPAWFLICRLRLCRLCASAMVGLRDALVSNYY